MEVGDNTNGGVGDEVNLASEGSLVCIKTSEPENHTSSETREREGGREGWREDRRERQRWFTLDSREATNKGGVRT